MKGEITKMRLLHKKYERNIRNDIQQYERSKRSNDGVIGLIGLNLETNVFSAYSVVPL